MKRLPTLYKTTGTGATQTWCIVVDGAETYTEFGPLGGTIQTSARERAEGKNAGKKNETTAEEQALLDAESKWLKKLGSGGYVRTLKAAKAGAADESVGGGTWPTLAKVYKKDGDKIVFPAFAQPKLDGHRCMAQFGADGRVKLWSRKHKEITSMPHVVSALEALGLKDCVLDGELFAPGMKFEQMAHFIRKPAPQPGGEALEYHVFDMVSDTNFEDRSRWLELAFEHAKPPLMLVPTVPVVDETELLAEFEVFVAEGHEGAMVRNRLGGYHSHPTHRSNDLQKIKEFDDAEWPIVGVKEGKGKLAGHAVFTCRTKNGVEFDVKLKGDTAALKAFFEHPETAVGKLLTVQYQGLTGKAGVPRFPVGLRLRDE